MRAILCSTVTNDTNQPPGQRLRAVRRRRRLTINRVKERLAARGVETSIGYLSDIERGARQPASLEMVLAFEETLGIPCEVWPNFTALSRFLELRRAS